MGGRRWPDTVKQAALLALESGASDSEVSELYGPPASTIRNWAAEAGITASSTTRPGGHHGPAQARLLSRKTLTLDELGPEARAKLPIIVSESLEKAQRAERGTDAFNFLRAVQIAGEICPELLTGIKGGHADGNDRQQRRGKLRAMVGDRRLGGRPADVSIEPAGSDD